MQEGFFMELGSPSTSQGSGSGVMQGRGGWSNVSGLGSREN